MEAKRTKRRLWIPHLTLRKYFRSTDVNPSMGGPVGSVPGSNGAAGGGGGGGGGEANHEMSTDLNLTQTMSRHDMLNNYVEDVELAGSRNQKGTLFSRDPDINPPETAFERFFYKVHIYSQWMSSIDAMFALKTSAGFVLLSLPAFLPQSYAWFFAQHGQWATVTLMMWMFPMAGMFAFTIILRILGTVLGGVAGIIIWEITRGNPYGLVILTFFVMWPLYYVFFTNQVLNIVAIMTQVTLMLVICYEYQFIANGVAVHDSVEMIAGKRILLVLIGVAASAILSMIPKPVTGRVELRKRLSQTIADMSKLYAILIGDLVTIYENNRDPTPGQTKAFKKLALGIRRQIADEQMFLKLSKLEPSMRGKFPVEVYTRLVEKVDNMSDLLLGMAYASKSIDRSWQRNIVHVLRQHRTEYLASILAIMKLLSATLSSKMALPPYMLSPKELRERLAQRLSQVIVESPDHLDMNTFPGYCAYAVNSFKFSEELGEVLECVEQLVGVEDPEQWLLIHA
ncbi:uncharacterized protein EV154DRAFT_441374 [Mucor mucedo]|uniref:uncharacterized protein n=1 Tax=Mucor mucedo TaxID=29922 RepID=UPI0022206707|nr:uncharacterized protein EV154DRAFT_441374 [Mucor mucedo]KAI7892507.1 hypothetical protein EV154DRAFT_441374 [Mucor mucedo]